MPDKRTFPILLGCFGRGECLYLQIASNIFIQRLENTLRKIIVSMRVTLDGFIAGPHGEMDWMEEFFQGVVVLSYQPRKE